MNGEDISKTNEKKRAQIRNKEIGIVLQDFALMEQYTVMENVLMSLYFSKGAGKKRDREQKELEILKQEEIMGVFKQLNEQGTTVVIITHDMEVANVCDRVVEISDGVIVSSGTVA